MEDKTWSVAAAVPSSRYKAAVSAVATQESLVWRDVSFCVCV